MSQGKVDVRGVLANLPLFRQLSAEEIDNLARGYTRAKGIEKRVSVSERRTVATGFL